MEVENKDVYLEFDKIEDVKDESSDEVIAKGLYLNDCIKKENLSIIDDVIADVIDLTKEKEDI